MIITSSEEDGDCDWGGVSGVFWGANNVLFLKQNQ